MELTKKLIEGNEKAFRTLFDAYHRRVYVFTLKSVGDATEAEDLTQSTFLKIWESRNNLAEDLPLEPQVFRIARSIVIDHYRARTSQQQFLYRLQQEQAPGSSPSSKFDSEKLASIRKAVEELPARRREVFKLSRYQGLTYEEIAEELSISRNTVHVHITKALATLRKKLTGWFF